MSRPERLRRDVNEVWWLVLLMVTGFFLAVVSHYVQGVYRRKPYPDNTFLFRPDDGEFPGSQDVVGVHGFGDLFFTWRLSGDPSPYLDLGQGAFLSSNYLPFTHLLLRPFTWLPYTLVLVLFLISLSVAVVGLLAAQLSYLDLPLRLLAAGVLGLLNYPVLLMLDRGNVEGLILLFLAAAILLARREAWVISAVLIGAAAAMKGYPVLFVLVLLGARRYRDSVIAVGTAGLLTLLSLLSFSGGLVNNVEAMLAAGRGFNSTADNEFGVQHGSSLRGLASALAELLPTWPSLGGVATAVSLALVVMGAAAVLSGRLFPWQSCAVVAALTVVALPVAFDYRLVLLVVPLLLMLGQPPGLLRFPALLVLGLLLVPKALPTLYGEVGLSALVNPILLLILVVALSSVALRQPSGSGASTQPEADTVPGRAAMSLT